MVSATLSGSHTHAVADGTLVHTWKRDGKYLARGSFQGRRFGETLGDGSHRAEARLRSILSALDRGCFKRATDRACQAVRTELVPKLTPPELVNAFLPDVRQRKGKRTADNYEDRLAPGVEFWEQNRKRWPFAADLDRAFAIELKAHLGRPGAWRPR